MKVVSVVGARPQFVKLAPVAEAFAHAGVEHVIVHTGQHYDSAMSDVFFADLKIPAPDIHLGIGSASHGAQTGAMLARLDEVFAATKVDWVLVYGDTNSTLAAALAAVKLHMPVAHLEAGLRSFNRRLPEEHNRVLTDHAADLLLAPTQVAVGHLESEGLGGRTVLVGDVMTDVCLRVRDAVTANPPQLPGGLPKGQQFYVATIHRPDNTDDPDRLADIVAALASLDQPVLLMTHPRLRDKAAAHGIALAGGSLIAVDPMPYPQMVSSVVRSSGVITDSGGLQKEAYLLGTVCTTVRTETEWIETLHDGWNILTNDTSQIAEAVARAKPSANRPDYYGDGAAAPRVVATLLEARK